MTFWCSIKVIGSPSQKREQIVQPGWAGQQTFRKELVAATFAHHHSHHEYNTRVVLLKLKCAHGPPGVKIQILIQEVLGVA